MLQLLNGPRRQHYPCNDGIDEKQQRISDTSCDTVEVWLAGGMVGLVMFMLSYLLPHFPQALQTMEQVAAPQQLAAKDMIYWTDLRVSLG